jgi:hypothetical protein
MRVETKTSDTSPGAGNVPITALNKPRTHLEHALALPNAYDPGWHVEETPAADPHAAPGGHGAGVAIPGTLHTRPEMHAVGAELPPAQ